MSLMEYPADITLTSLFTFTNEVAHGWLGAGILFSFLIFIMGVVMSKGYNPLVAFASASWGCVVLGVIFLAIPILTSTVLGVFIGMALLSTALLVIK